MAIEDFLKTWVVVKPPEPECESEGHRVTIKREGHGDDNVLVGIICDVHGKLPGIYYRESNRIVGEGFHIKLAPPTTPPRIVCAPGNVPNTGSWTAEDTSGQLQ